MFRWVNILKGFLMGVCELIPGVSSGTMALLLGIYDQFLGAISRLLTKDFKKAVVFLIPIVLGMGLAIISMTSLMDFLLQNHTVPTHFFFLGMVLGVVPMMLRLSNVKSEFTLLHYILVVLSLLLVYFLSVIQDPDAAANAEISLSQMLFLYFAGTIGAGIMLLPGISGSLVMLILGAYPTIIYSISEFTSFNFSVTPLLIATGLGILTGILGASKVISYFLRNYTYLMYAAIIGLLLGSVFPIFPGLPSGGAEWSVSVITFLSGLLISLYMGMEKRNGRQSKKS
ncbi:DUF368 domain-containing protein [Corticicoccus populi]|uniref:DUF368 domain-containing protein n=1 Tax=Corticicoccus populi TaxID=1812821 RepID=A0ABW5WXY6_9STAP